LSEPSLAANFLRWGTGAINIDACRIESTDEIRPFGGIMNGTGESRPQFSPSTLGRWPANVITDGSAELLAAFPDSEPSIASDRSRRTAMFSDSTLPDGGVRGHTDSGGSAARFFFSAKADADDRLGSKHPTVKPVDLMQWLCRLVTPRGGTILDPFAGTGTTGEAAYREGFNAVLIERELEYLADIARRMALAAEGRMTRKHESAKARANGKAPDHGPLFGGIEVAGGRQIYGKFADQIGRSDQRGSNGEDP
jgi:site-specific DNA-methyltransferase (adenine-specific)